MTKAKVETCSLETVVEHSKILASIPLMADDIKTIKKVLIDGNGVPGLVTLHSILRTEYDFHILDHKTSVSAKRWMIGLAVTVLLSCAVTVYSTWKTNEQVIEDQKKIEQIIQSTIDRVKANEK